MLNTASGLRPRHAHIFPPDALSHYVEPQWCSARLFVVESFGAPGACILDPACGWGRIPKAAHDAGFLAIGSDVVDRRGDPHAFALFQFSVCNFLKVSPVRSVWSVVVNPPFDHIQEFCERALAIAIFKVAVLVPLRRIVAAHWLQRLPLESVYLLTPRPSMPPSVWIAAGGSPGGGTQDFAWLIFNKQIAVARRPTLGWLHREQPHQTNGDRHE